jgi:predicted nuclease of predicted toxin-antitoxin system
MIFLLDENFPKRATAVLSEKGHHVFDVRDSGKIGASDEEILGMAKQKKAILLTTDKDFYHTLHLTEKPHYGIIVIALKQPNSKHIIEKLMLALENVGFIPLKDRCLLVTDSKSYIF